MKSLRIIFAGTPDFALPCLKALLASPHSVVAVYTQPDRPAGRGRHAKASVIKEHALQAKIPVEQPATLKDAAALAQLAHYQADLMVVVAYGLILPSAVLQTPTYGCLNVHASLLPRWRGAAPIQRALQAGDVETGITIMQMDKGLDTGNSLLQMATPIMREDTSQTLHDRLAQIGAESLMKVIHALADDSPYPPIPQPQEGVTYAHKIEKTEAHIDWHQSALNIERQIRAFTPWPKTETIFQNKPLYILSATAVEKNAEQLPGHIESIDKKHLEVATAKGTLTIHQLQCAGKNPITISDFYNAWGHSLQPGDPLFVPPTQLNVFLIGPMGAGKTSVGKRLAQKLNWEYIDTDQYIEDKTGVSISWIFDKEGEPKFREREKNAIKTLSQSSHLIIATGGGAILLPENRALMKSTGIVIYLTVSIDQQLDRALRAHRKRPLLETADPKETLQQLNALRDPLYREIANFICNTDEQSPETIAHTIYTELTSQYPKVVS